jgi:hypothetical protein
VFDDGGLGLEGSDGVNGLFAMMLVFPNDLDVAFR